MNILPPSRLYQDRSTTNHSYKMHRDSDDQKFTGQVVLLTKRNAKYHHNPYFSNLWFPVFISGDPIFASPTRCLLSYRKKWCIAICTSVELTILLGSTDQINIMGYRWTWLRIPNEQPQTGNYFPVITNLHQLHKHTCQQRERDIHINTCIHQDKFTALPYQS